MEAKRRIARQIFDAAGHKSLDTPAFKVGWGCLSVGWLACSRRWGCGWGRICEKRVHLHSVTQYVVNGLLCNCAPSVS